MEINESTLLRLTQKAYTIEPEDKNLLYHAILSIIKEHDDSVDDTIKDILKFFEDELMVRVSSIAGGLMNPKSAPKKPLFCRADAEPQDAPTEPETDVNTGSGLIIL